MGPYNVVHAWHMRTRPSVEEQLVRQACYYSCKKYIYIYIHKGDARVEHLNLYIRAEPEYSDIRSYIRIFICM